MRFNGFRENSTQFFCFITILLRFFGSWISSGSPSLFLWFFSFFFQKFDRLFGFKIFFGLPFLSNFCLFWCFLVRILNNTSHYRGEREKRKFFVLNFILHYLRWDRKILLSQNISRSFTISPLLEIRRIANTKKGRLVNISQYYRGRKFYTFCSQDTVWIRTQRLMKHWPKNRS